MDVDIRMEMLNDSPRHPHRESSEPAFTLDHVRMAILEEMDSARFSWFQVKVCIVAGVGFFTDAYDIFTISIAVVMIGLVYPGKECNNLVQSWGYKMGNTDELLIKLGTPLGNLCGQLAFGWLADVLGRKRMYGYELIIIIVSTFGQAVAGNSPGISIYVLLFVWRFGMGLGIGGDYPLSAILASEFAAKRYRGRMMTAVFAAQGWGTLTAALAAVIITEGYSGNSTNNNVFRCPEDPSDHTNLTFIDPMWRLLVGFGCVPAAIALYFRLTIPETPRFSMDVEGDLSQAFHDIRMDVLRSDSDSNTATKSEAPRHNIRVPRATWKDFRAYFGQSGNSKLLFATAYCWFALDVAYYGLGLNQPAILQYIGQVDPDTQDVHKYLSSIATANLIVVAAGQLPGYWVTFFLIDAWGRKPIQYLGFAATAAIFLTMGLAYEKLIDTKPVFVFFYLLANFFFNFGPNVTTFIIPGEVFPTRYRATGHGISAASGKLGAVIAQIIFHLVSEHDNLNSKRKTIKISFIIFSVFMLTGVGATYLLPETKQKSLEELSNEDQDTFVQGST
ncbi:phosphate transporter [Crepidotus variabilis]|uniref:Phosphate transporter n=1 Tax=Crepidotus variabilis TaxID=179855 RepID=A0A9P6E3F2_9AGAR|nr:phosphate transporter [Crepidotus variabilis]